MARTLTTVVLTLVVAAVIVAVAALAYMYSGRYNVAATAEHTSFSRWMLRTTKENSIRAHAEKVGAAPALNDKQLHHGVEHYKNTCVACHGAPGVERGELGKGIAPTPPDLAKAATHWSERELFWIVKHGIKLAGMPAFGVTHSDEELWALAAFVKRLPDMTPEQYAELTHSKSASAGASGHR